MRTPRLRVAWLVAAAALIVPAPALANPGLTIRLSVSSAGAQANSPQSDTGSTSISRDGSVAAFSSVATNLVAGDTYVQKDVFARDQTSGTVTRMSVADNGTRGNSDSASPSISADGRYVAFDSAAANLVTGDTNVASDVFVHDRQARTTVRVSVAGDGTQGDGESRRPSISANGRFVAFDSRATNLTPGDTNGATDVFVHDRDADANGIYDEPGVGKTSTTPVSVATPETQAALGGQDAAISADGRDVAFQSYASDLVAGDSNGVADVFVRDRTAATTVRVSVAGDGTQGNDVSGGFSPGSLAISGDGSQVTFQSGASNLVASDTNATADVFVRDRTAGTTVRVSVTGDGSQANGYSDEPSLSFDGRLVSFYSQAANLGGNPGSIYVHDRDAESNGIFDQTGVAATTTTLESVDSDGTPANNGSGGGVISADGSRLAFVSQATNLVADDTNNAVDDFMHTLSRGVVDTQTLSVAKSGEGRGTVTSAPARIDCGSICTKNFASGTTVTLRAVAAAGSTFTGFSGEGCTGTGPCTVTLDQARSVTAAFALIRHVLTITPAGDGRGRVTSSPTGIDCGADCAQNYAQGTVVTLTATPISGLPRYSFSGFSGGGCSATATTCTLTIDQAKSVTATFALVRHVLTVSRAGDGQGAVTSSPAGIDCGDDCTEGYADATEVTLRAAAEPGSQFTGFSGACSGTGPCTVRLSQTRSVRATFDSGGGSGLAPPAPGAAPELIPPAGTPRPVLSALTLSPARFRAARSGPSIAGALGARVSYRLSQAGSVRFSVQRAVAGRRSHGGCIASSPSNRRAARCIRYVTLRGSFTHAGTAGPNALRFSGRLAGRRLAPGRYRLLAVAAGATSPPRRVSFRIVRR